MGRLNSRHNDFFNQKTDKISLFIEGWSIKLNLLKLYWYFDIIFCFSNPYINWNIAKLVQFIIRVKILKIFLNTATMGENMPRIYFKIYFVDFYTYWDLYFIRFLYIIKRFLVFQFWIRLFSRYGPTYVNCWHIFENYHKLIWWNSIFSANLRSNQLKFVHIKILI